MKDLVASFPNQLREALDIAGEATMQPPAAEIRNVLIAGMGGSGIGAVYARSLVQNSCPAPVTVVNDYNIPACADHHTLGIVSSYSGNTEETIAAFHRMLEAGIRPVVISSGGALLESARQESLNHIQLPGGWPAPRACLGYSLVSILSVLNSYNLIESAFADQVRDSADLLDASQDDIRQRAGQLAGFLMNKVPILYTSPELEPVAVRFRQQLAENSKVLAWHHVIPEMNHNEIVGWHQRFPESAVLFLSHRDMHPRTRMRMDFIREITGRYAGATIELKAKGDSLLSHMIYLTHLADWCSVFLAEQRNVDVMAIKSIDALKDFLAKN